MEQTEEQMMREAAMRLVRALEGIDFDDAKPTSAGEIRDSIREVRRLAAGVSPRRAAQVEEDERDAARC